MALFAIPNALADVTVTETSTLTKGVDYFLPSGSKGDIVLTLADGFSSVAAGTTLVTAKAETTGTQTMEIVTAGSGAFRGKANGSNYGTAGTNAPSGSSVTVRFDKDNGAFVYDGMTTTTKLMEVSGLRYSATIGGAYSYSVAETDVITSATFADSSVGIIKNLSGSGDLTSSKSFLIIENGGNNGVNLNLNGKALSIAGSVVLGAITSGGYGSGVYIAKGASLTAQSINCSWNPGTMVINGEVAVQNLFRMSTNAWTNIQGVGSMTVASLETNNGGKINTSLNSFRVTGNATVGGSSGAITDTLTISGGTFTVGGTTTVLESRTLTISGSGTASFGDLNLSGRFVNTGSLSIRDGATVTFNDGCLKYCSEGDLTTGNGFGVFNSVALKDVLGENAMIGAGVAWKQGTADISLGADNVFTLANEVTSATTYYINDATASWDYSGATKLVVSATNGTVGLSSAFAGDLTVKGGSVTASSTGGGQGCITGDVIISNGGTFSVSGSDSLGWVGGTYTKSVTLQGEEGAVSKLVVNNFTGLSGNLYLSGHTEVATNAESSVASACIEFYGGSIIVTGTDNVISTGLALRGNNENTATYPDRNLGVIDVGDGASLLISGRIWTRTDWSGDGKNAAQLLTKRGNGILTLAGTIEGGTIKGAGTTNITGQIIAGNVQDVNILATQTRINTATLGGTVNFDTVNGSFTQIDEFYSATTGIQTYTTGKTVFISGKDLSQVTGVDFRLNGATSSDLVVDSDGVHMGGVTTNTTTYLIANADDEVTWSDVTSAGGRLVKFTRGGKLTTAETDVISSSAIEVATGVTGSRLSGSGKYVLVSGSTDIKVESLTDWTGTVELSGSYTESLDLGSSKLGNTGSTILINNVSASLTGTTVNANVQLASPSGNDGLTITGTGATVTFNGNVTGVLTGDKTAINIINRASGTTLNFAGEENKAVQIIDESGSAISFSGKATDISTSIVSQMANTITSVSFDNTAAVSMSGDILNDKWSNQNAKGDLSVNLKENTKVTFIGTVHANTLNVESGAEASFTKATSLDKVVGSGTFSSTVEQAITLGTATDSKFTGSIKSLDGAVIKTTFAGTGAQEGSLAKIDATAGSVNLLNTSSVSVTDMVIGEGKTVGVYSGTTVPDLAATGNEGTLTVTNLTVTSSSDKAATLNANLTLNGVLTLNGALTMGSELTLGSGSTLANTGYAHISDITKDTEITLFSSVDKVTYGTTELTAGSSVDAHNVFGNLNTGDFTIRFDNGDVILKANNNVPEPTTATLSLLALMGLAARRRRKAAK